MKQILENLEIAEEVKTELVESFDKAVLVEAIILAESKEEAYEEYGALTLDVDNLVSLK